MPPSGHTSPRRGRSRDGQGSTRGKFPIPVLVITHIEDPEIHEQMLHAGAAEVLPKDVTLREVLACRQEARTPRLG